MPHRSSARLLAPVALAVAALAVFIVIGQSGSDKSSRSASSTSTTQRKAPGGGSKSGAVARANPRRPRGHRTYVVQAGDTLSKIATRTGVSLATLGELNPNVDPQGLHAGQKLRLK